MSKESDFLATVKENYQESIDGWRHIYDEARSDTKFCYDVDDGQWPSGIRAEREKDGRPVLTINKLQKFLRQIRGDQMQNRPRVKVIPVDSKSDPDMAELYNGIIRQIEYHSNAGVAYDTAYNHAISSSFGFWRFVTKYADDNSFDQEIFIKRVINPLSVHFDPYATEFCLEDAQYCFVEDLIDKKRYKLLWPDAEFGDFDSNGIENVFGDWLKQDKVRIAEYFYKDTVQKKIALLKDGRVIPIDKEVTFEALKHMGHEVVKDRLVDTTVVKWCKLSGAEVLEESTWITDDIPVIPVFGDEVIADGKRYLLSLARGAKGPQQMYNYWATAGTETVALAPKNPYVVEHRQIQGFEAEWDEAHRTNRPYVRYRHVNGLQKPQRENQTQVPTGIMAMMERTAFDVEDHLGRYEASQGQTSNERSGKAIVARIQQSDKGTYTFVDNFTRSFVASGKQLIKMIPKVYDTHRALRIQGEDGKEDSVEVNKPILAADGSAGKMNDLSVGKYDLIASIGSSFASKRQEMVADLKESMQYAPNIAQIIAPLIFKYSDAPGSQEVYAELKKGIDQLQQQEALQGVK